jgi:hypothetical protein
VLLGRDAITFPIYNPLPVQIIESRRTYDVCIVGSGAGGRMAARVPLEMGFVGRKWKTKTATERAKE